MELGLETSHCESFRVDEIRFGRRRPLTDAKSLPGRWDDMTVVTLAKYPRNLSLDGWFPLQGLRNKWI
jgi:hypothetical protein